MLKVYPIYKVKITEERADSMGIPHPHKNIDLRYWAKHNRHAAFLKATDAIEYLLMWNGYIDVEDYAEIVDLVDEGLLKE